MKRILCLMLLCLVLFPLSSYSGWNPVQPQPTARSAPELREEKDTMMTIQIMVEDQVFLAKLYDNPATQAFVKLLPLTITMDELNGNEKFYYLPEDLPASASKPTEIKAGDLMLYGSDCLVLFYESFSSPYSYTRLGYVEDAAGLSSALGNQQVQIVFLKNPEET